MKALVLGANGCLGKALTELLPTHDGGGFEVEGRGRAECDVTNPTAAARIISEAEADVVFNAAAYTNVDRAEDEPDVAYQANALGPETLARVTAALGVKLIHYSTDFVFDGEQERPYDEFDPPAPQGIYARSKLAGERLACAASRKVFVVRVGCLYGRDGKNFPSTILSRLLAGQTVRADRDRVGTPTWVHDVASVSGALAHTEHFGLYHCTSAGETTWADYARFIASELGLSDDRVQALPTADLPAMRAPRPRRAVLDNRMLRLRGLDSMPDWRVAARAFIRATRPVT
ncbi:MAG: dTDP-4-dehydrorhamnose reductase [Deltaproteobacteria bacterium]|nr:dTDP-4-dehydrorhamnose reductase [Deltaproteobacteria bacterium]